MSKIVRTKQAGDAWATTVEPEGGGSGSIVVETADVSSAQILALNLTPVEITSTPAADKIILPISVLTRYIPGPGPVAYTNTNADDIYFSTIEEWNGSNGGYWFRLAKLNFMTIPWTFETQTLQGLPSDDVSVDGSAGQALAIFTQGASSAYENGDASLRITTVYTLVDA